MGLFRDDGFRDPLYEDDETLVTAGKHGYVLAEGHDNPRHAKLHGPLKEYEMLELLDDLRVPHRKKIAKAIREHADRFPRYQSNVRVAKPRKGEEPETEDGREQKSKGSGCGCLIWLFIIAAAVYFASGSL